MAEKMDKQAPLREVLSHEPDPQVREYLALLADMGQQFAQSLDIQQTLNNAVHRIADTMHAQAASVFMIDGTELVCRACAGPVEVRGLRVPLQGSLVGKSVRDDRSIIVRDVAADPDFAGFVDEKTGFATRSVLCAPLRSVDGVIGALQILNRNDGSLFDQHDQRILEVLAAPTALAIHNAKMAERLVAEEALRKELAMARKLQRSLLPATPPVTFPIAGANISAREVSGDFYDFFPCGDRLVFSIGDVSGKGMDAALLMARTTSLLHWISKREPSPAVWLEQVNAELIEKATRGMFVCAVAGYYEPSTRRVVFANAGFPPPIFADATNGGDASGPPLGILSELGCQDEEAILDGSNMLFFTDGAIEAEDIHGELGMDGLRRLFANTAALAPAGQISRLANALRDLELRDDTTLLVVGNG